MTLNNDPNILFSTQQQNNNSAPRVPVIVSWGGVNISDITGPTPFVDISQEVNRNENGQAQSTKYNVTLTGKILRVAAATGETDCPNERVLTPANLGISSLLGAASGLQNLFKNCPTSIFKIQCGPATNGGPAGLPLYEITGARFVNFNLEKSNDNWTKSVDFTVNIEYEEPLPGTSGDLVRDTSDTWSIEPLDDVVYTKFVMPVKQRSEWSNPFLQGGGSGPPSSDSTYPPGAVGAQGAGTVDLQIIQVPQFRITRRLSAKGLPIVSGTGSGPCSTGAPTAATARPITYEASYLQAKAWVEKQSAYLFTNPSPSGKPYFTRTPNISNFTKTFLYNYTRSVNIDVNAASYEATDTWIAMPTGMPYVESYTLEASTSLEMIKTVRVAGNIQGLSFTSFSAMNGSSGYFPTGTGLDQSLSLEWSLIPPTAGPIPVYNLPDVPGVNSTLVRLEDSRYKNALNGWLKDIKPYMYRRACLAVNSSDRTRTYVPAYAVNPPRPPENPIYSTETMLSVIPVSTSEGHDPKKGTISYSYEYNNKFNIISGVISENITISNEGPADVVAETQVPGRALGPILAKNGSTATKKTFNIEVVVMPPTGIDGFFVNNPACPVFTGGYIYTLINKLVEGIKPFGSTANDSAIFGQYARGKNQQGVVFVNSDTDSWTPTQGRYTRTVSWTYQQCTNSRYYLDH